MFGRLSAGAKYATAELLRAPFPTVDWTRAGDPNERRNRRNQLFLLTYACSVASLEVFLEGELRARRARSVDNSLVQDAREVWQADLYRTKTMHFWNDLPSSVVAVLRRY